MSNGQKQMINLGEVPEIGKKPPGPPQGGPGAGIPVPQFINNILIPKIGELEEKIEKLITLFEVLKVVQPAFPSKIEVTIVQAPAEQGAAKEAQPDKFPSHKPEAPKAKKPTVKEAKKDANGTD